MDDMICGNWRVETEEPDEPEEGAYYFSPDWRIDADEVIVTIGFTILEIYGYRIDPATNPKSIDLFHRRGELKGKTTRGIYKLEDDRLWVCLAEAGVEDRPTELADRADGVWTLVSLARWSRSSE